MKSVDTTSSSVYPRKPFMGPSAAAFTAFLMSSYVVCQKHGPQGQIIDVKIVIFLTMIDPVWELVIWNMHNKFRKDI